ncbi:MAG: DUF2220 family protein [Luteolibacter sp.]
MEGAEDIWLFSERGSDPCGVEWFFADFVKIESMMAHKYTWLVEFHRRWHAARGKRVNAAKRPFSCEWEDEFLKGAGIYTAEDEATAMRELEHLAKSGYLRIKYYKPKKIERVVLPLEQEAWLCGLFGTIPAYGKLKSSLEILAAYDAKNHARFPEEWRMLLLRLKEAFSAGRCVGLFYWNRSEALAELLEMLWKLTEREWETGTAIESASSEVFQDAKAIGRNRRSLEAGMTQLFGATMKLKSLGLVVGHSCVELSGSLELHFADGASQSYRAVDFATIQATDMARCVRITTTAERLLTIENKKATFRQFAQANRDRGTLLATTSFPSPVFVEFLEKLPKELPHFHFGDTDPAGWLILEKLRKATARKVRTFHMKWRAGRKSELTKYDLALLPKLLASDALEDVRGEIAAILEKEDHGDFEQESLGAPTMQGWPFFISHLFSLSRKSRQAGEDTSAPCSCDMIEKAP